MLGEEDRSRREDSSAGGRKIGRSVKVVRLLGRKIVLGVKRVLLLRRKMDRGVKMVRLLKTEDKSKF